MKDISRREVLIGTAAVTALAALPAPVAADILPSPLPVEVTPAWAVGTPGEFNWQHIVAKTAEEAQRIFRDQNCDWECDEGSPCGECDGCTLEVEAERKSIWDGIANPSRGDWLRAGMGAHCSRCSYETFPEEDGHAVGDEAVCHDCMKLADWDIVDPERAAEMRAELAEEST